MADNKITSAENETTGLLADQSTTAEKQTTMVESAGLGHIMIFYSKQVFKHTIPSNSHRQPDHRMIKCRPQWCSYLVESSSAAFIIGQVFQL